MIGESSYYSQGHEFYEKCLEQRELWPAPQLASGEIILKTVAKPYEKYKSVYLYNIKTLLISVLNLIMVYFLKQTLP